MIEKILHTVKKSVYEKSEGHHTLFSMKKSKNTKGHSLLELLISLCIASFISIFALEAGFSSLKNSRFQVQKLYAVNELRNVLERFRANPADRSGEFNRWNDSVSKSLPKASGDYQCKAVAVERVQCRVSLRWGSSPQALSLEALL